MFSKPEEVLEFIKNEDVKFVDVRFCDLPGVMQHFNVPAASLTLDFFTEGQMFDGSSIRGFQAIHESDMKLIPDATTAYLDPFRTQKTLIMNFSIVDPFTDEPYSRDPRNIAAKAEAYLKSTGIADAAYFGAEAEFYIFDDVRFETKQNASYVFIDSIEAAWNTGRVEEGGNRGLQDPLQGWLLPGPAGRPLRRHARRDVPEAGRCRSQRRAQPPRGGRRRPAGDQLPLRLAAAVR